MRHFQKNLSIPVIFLMIFGLNLFAFANNDGTDVHNLVCNKKKPIIWDMKGSPYIIKTNIWLPADCTLMIKKGVVVIFEQPAFLVINGTLKVQGTKKDPVLFTSNLIQALEENPYLLDGGDTSWLFIENGRADIRSANFEWMDYGVRARNSNVNVRQCTFSNILQRNIWYDNSNGFITNNTITQSNPLDTESNYFGIKIDNSTNLEANIIKIQHNQIIGNTPPSFPVNIFHAILIEGSANVNIDSNCIIEKSGQYGIILSVSEGGGGQRFVPEGKITNNILEGLFIFGIDVENYAPGDDQMISVEYNRVTFQGTPDNLIPWNSWGGIVGINLNNINARVMCNIVEGWDFPDLSDEEKHELMVAMMGIGLSGTGTYLVSNNWVRNNNQGFFHMMNPDGFILMTRNQIEGNHEGIYFHDNHDSAVTSEIRENNFINNNTNLFIPTWSWIEPDQPLPPPIHVENNYWGATSIQEIIGKFCCGAWTGLLEDLLLFEPFAVAPFETAVCLWQPPVCVGADQGIIFQQPQRF